jgi:arylsulfatase A-like enzyme
MVLWTDYEEPLIEAGRPTIASLLKTTGYTTACIGKWHLGMNFAKPGGGFVRGKRAPQRGAGGTREVDFSQPIKGGPSELGFDTVWAIPAGHNLEPHFYVDGDRPAANPSVWRGNAQPSKPGLSALETHEGWMTPDWDDQQVGPTLTSKALAFIERSARDKRPFLLYYAAQSPHRPCTPPDFAKGKSEAGVRGDMVWELDWTVGQITARLDELGIAGDTLIIVTSDNGAVKVSDEGKDFGHASCGPLRAFKTSIHEGGHRVPFIARWPGVIKAGSTNDSAICLTDLFVTFAVITGTAVPQNSAEDSFSILPALRGSALGDDRPPVVHHSGGGQFAIRQGRWKLILDMKDKPVMLFDVRADPAETTNRLKDEPALAARLAKKLAEIRTSGRTQEA